MKNKTTLLWTALLASFLSATSLMGQGRFSIAPTFSPTFQHLNWSSQFDHVDGAKGSRTTTGISVGLTASYAFTPKWSLSAGLLYNRSSGNSSYDNFKYVTTQAGRNENWQLPLLLNYTSSTYRLSPYFSAGLLANHQYRTTNLTTLASSYHKLDEGSITTFTLYGMVGMGLHYRVKPQLASDRPTDHGLPVEYPFSALPPTYTRWNDYLLGLQMQVKFTF